MNAPPKVSRDVNKYQALAERICEAAADEFGVLDKPVLMAETKAFEMAKRTAAAALRIAGLSTTTIAVLLGYSEHSVVVHLRRFEVDKPTVYRILRAAGWVPTDA